MSIKQQQTTLFQSSHKLQSVGKKRKLRQLLQRLIKLFSIFLITIGILLVLFTKTLFAPQKVTSPIAIVPTITGTTPSQDSFTSVLETTLQQQHLDIDLPTTATDSGVLIHFHDGEQIIFAQDKSINEQIASLQLIKQRLTIEGKRLRRVDFRFDKPVVSY